MGCVQSAFKVLCIWREINGGTWRRRRVGMTFVRVFLQGSDRRVAGKGDRRRIEICMMSLFVKVVLLAFCDAIFDCTLLKL
jgi:hypothetical protein